MVFDSVDALESAGLITLYVLKNKSVFSEGRCLLIHSHRD